MNNYFVLLILFVILIKTINSFICNNNFSVNHNPVIGILAQEVYEDQFSRSFIVSSYVKFIESAGAQVIPILLNYSHEEYVSIYSKINGIVFPGGGVDLENSRYSKVANIFWSLATETNQNFPILGICLGFELLFELAFKKNYLQSNCLAIDDASSVNFTMNDEFLFTKSKLFQNADIKVINNLKNNNTIYMHHRKCLTKTTFDENNFNKTFVLLATNTNKDGIEYASIIEHIHYPFYGTQFHPEKNLFEFIHSPSQANIPHNQQAIQVSQFFANQFIEEARKNKNCFQSKTDLDTILIYNFKTKHHHLRREHENYEQVYYFDD